MRAGTAGLGKGDRSPSAIAVPFYRSLEVSTMNESGFWRILAQRSSARANGQVSGWTARTAATMGASAAAGTSTAA